MFWDKLHVESLMVGGEDQAVGSGDLFSGELNGAERTSLRCVCLRDVGIVVLHQSAFVRHDVHDAQGGRFVLIVDIGFVCHTQEEDATAVDDFAVAVKCHVDFDIHIVWHSHIDMTGRVNHAQVEIILLDDFPFSPSLQTRGLWLIAIYH